MFEYFLVFLTGVAVPILINLFQISLDRRKFYIQRKDKYKLVAVERRLEAHQQSFHHWCRLSDVIHEKDIEKRGKIINDAEHFFCNNCFYLEKRSREEFRTVISLVTHYPTFLENWREQDRGPDKEKAHKELLDAWDRIFKLPEIIQSDVELEPIRMETEETPEGSSTE